MDAVIELIEKYRLTDHSDTIFNYARIFRNKVESLNNDYFFDRDKRVKGYNEQYKQLREYIHTATPDSIKLSFGGKQLKLFEGTPKEETRFFPQKEIEITNEILIQDILIAINAIIEPKIKPHSDTSRRDTFRSEFLKSTKPLYDYLIENKLTKNKHRFICELIEKLGFDWSKINQEPVEHLKRKFKEK